MTRSHQQRQGRRRGWPAVRVWLVLLVVLVAPWAAAQVPGATTLSVGWRPEEPEPSFVLAQVVGVTYNWSGPALTTDPTHITIHLRASEIALNATCGACGKDVGVNATVFPTGGSVRTEFTVVLRWLFPPARNATGAPLDIAVTADANGNLQAASTKAQMVVRYPAPPPPLPSHAGPPTPAPVPLPAGLALAALGLAALRRVHGRA